jgi:hypothetical protein
MKPDSDEGGIAVEKPSCDKFATEETNGSIIEGTRAVKHAFLRVE